MVSTVSPSSSPWKRAKFIYMAGWLVYFVLGTGYDICRHVQRYDSLSSAAVFGYSLQNFTMGVIWPVSILGRIDRAQLEQRESRALDEFEAQTTAYRTNLESYRLESVQRSAYVNAAKTQINAFHTPLEAYRLDLKSFPTSSQGLQALRTIPADLASPTRWQGPYLDNEIPLDPWDNEYRYEYPGKRQADRPDIWSLGPDGADGTEDDIGNWMTSRTEQGS